MERSDKKNHTRSGVLSVAIFKRLENYHCASNPCSGHVIQLVSNEFCDISEML